MKAWSFLGVLLVALGGVVASPAGEIKTYAGHGLVQGIAEDRREVTIQHDAIPGYMMGMTMEFRVKDTNDLAGIAAGDEINFTLAVSDTESWVQNLRLLAHHVSEVTSNTFVFHTDLTELRTGIFCRTRPCGPKVAGPCGFPIFMARRWRLHSFSRAVRCPIIACG